MQISSSLRDLTQQAVKQLFTPVSQPREADGNKEAGVAPFDRLRAMMAENGGKPSFKILSEFLRMELEDQKAFAEQAGGWLLDIHSQLEDGYRSHGLREVVVHGIHQAAASGQQWNGFVKSGGQTYGLGYGVNPDQVENYAKDAIEDRRQYIKWGIGRLNEFLEDQESYFKNDPEFFQNLPSSISVDSPEQSEGLSFLSILSDAGVRIDAHPWGGWLLSGEHQLHRREQFPGRRLERRYL